MQQAISNNDGEQVKKLLQENNKIIYETFGSENNTPLHEACLKPSFSICKILLEHKANASISNKHGNQPLHKITIAPETDMAEKHKIIKILIKHNADINTTNNEGKSVIHIAASKGHSNTLIILSNQEGCKLNINDR